MAVLRPHLALTVTDVERSIPFYEALFGTSAEKARQDKIWVHDPDGTPWEVFATHEDVEERDTSCCKASCCT